MKLNKRLKKETESNFGDLFLLLDYGDMNIIFDLDGTLIADDPDKNVIPRPYVDDFLEFCFEKFKNVGIWTAASPGWAEKVIDRIFSPDQKRKLKFIWTDDYCDADLRGYILKPLEKVWKHPELKKLGFRKNNTIILEDTHRNCQRNLGNNIILKSYKLNIHTANDNTLLRLMGLLEKSFFGGKQSRKRVGGSKKKYNVRNVNFLSWNL